MHIYDEGDPSRSRPHLAHFDALEMRMARKRKLERDEDSLHRAVEKLNTTIP